MKVHGTFNKAIVKQCQYYGGFLPISHLIGIKWCRFLKQLANTDNRILQDLSVMFGKNDLQEIASLYSSSDDIFKHNFLNIITDNFKAVALCQWFQNLISILGIVKLYSCMKFSL